MKFTWSCWYRMSVVVFAVQLSRLETKCTSKGSMQDTIPFEAV